MNSFFKDLKVVELANVLAGPAVGLFFAELGAEVIKIENKLTGGDVTRSWKSSSENADSEISAYYASVNWSKRSLMLDLTDPQEKEQVYELIKNADIVICNYKFGDDRKLGMDYHSLKKINPLIIYGQITGFGDESRRTAYDLVLQAETGFMHMNGTKESGPVKMPVALIDILAAHQLKEALLVALINKLKTGEGSKVSVSLYDAAIASLANQATNWLMVRKDPEPTGTLHPNIAPYGEMFTTLDNKKIVLAIGNNKQFELLCKVLKCEALIKNLKFINNSERVKNRNELYDLLSPVFSKINASLLMEKFIRYDVPAGRIKSVKEVFEDPSAQSLINKEKTDNFITERVKTVIFKTQTHN